MTTDLTTAEPLTTVCTISKEDVLAAFILFMVSFFGILMVGLVAYYLPKSDKINSQFGLLCVSLSIADLGVLVLFCFWCVPQIIIKSPLGYFGMRIGRLTPLFWNAGVYTSAAISLNRYCAIAYPIKMKKWFTKRNTGILIIICWIAACVNMSFFFGEGCDFFFLPEYYVWVYADTECGRAISKYMDWYFNTFNLFAIFILNMTTLAKLKNFNNRYIAAQGKRTDNRKQEINRRKRQEVRFFIQSLVNILVYEFVLIAFHGLSVVFNTKWGWFFTVNIAWLCAHLTNGLATLVINKDFREETFKKFLGLNENKDERSGLVVAFSRNKVGPESGNTKAENNKISKDEEQHLGKESVEEI